MKINKSYLLLIFIVLILIVYNRSENNKERMPGIEIDLEKMNQEMNITLYPIIGPLKKKDILGFYVQNLSDSIIIIKEAQAYKLFIKTDDGQWHTVKDNMTIPIDRVYQLLPKRGKIYSRYSSSVAPEITEANKKVTLRIVVIGQEILSENSVRNVAAYTDVSLSPE